MSIIPETRETCTCSNPLPVIEKVGATYFDGEPNIADSRDVCAWCGKALPEPVSYGEAEELPF